MEEIIERIKNNRMAQIALAMMVVAIIGGLYFLNKLFSGKESKKPCYNQTITILSPFEDKKFDNIKRIFSPYCIKIETVKKTTDYIRANLLKDIAKGEIPDIVYIDNDFINENKDMFKEYNGNSINFEQFPKEFLFYKNGKPLNYPLAFDTLVMFSNEKYLNILGVINPPNTFESLIDLVRNAKNNPFLQGVIPIALGTSNNIDNFYEIFVTIHKNLNPNRYKFVDSFEKTLDFYTQFADKSSNLYSWSNNNNNSLEEFGRGSVIFAFGFYSDNKKIKDINNRLNFRITEFPKFANNTNQTNFMKIYGFAVPKQGKHKFAWIVLEILDKNYEEFIKDFDLLPTRKDIYEKLTGDKKEIAKDMLIGSDFSEFNRDYAENIFKDLVSRWLEDKTNAKLSLYRVQTFKIFTK